MCCNSPTVPSQHKGPRVFWKNLLCKNKNTKKVIRGNWRRQTRFRRGHIQKRIITNQYPCEVYLWCFSVLFQMQRRSHVSQSATRACLSVRPQAYPGTWDTHSLPPTGRQKLCFYKKLLYLKKNSGYIFLLLYLGAHAREGTQSITSLQIWHGAQAIKPLGPMGVQYLFSTLL